VTKVTIVAAVLGHVLGHASLAADWDCQDLVRPYWRLMEEDRIDCRIPLIKKDGRLLSSCRPNGDDRPPQIALEGEHAVLRLFHLAIGCRNKGLWDTLVELDVKGKVPRGTHDQDGWTLDDYIHQAKPGADYIRDSGMTLVRGITQDPGAVLFPKGWAGESGYGSRMERMDIEEDGLVVKFEGEWLCPLVLPAASNSRLAEPRFPPK